MKNLLYIFFPLLLLSCKQKDGNLFFSKKIPVADTGYRKLTDREKAYYTARIQKMYDSMFGRNFNGAILVAKNGQVLFEDYKGYIDLNTKDTITPTTSFHIASTSKTFTGVAILKLWEQGKLSLEDSIQKFFPELPYHGITIRMMLNHRSGLPNYVHTMPVDTAWFWRKKHYATNNDMLQFLIEKHPGIQAFPNRRFSYCNTNFALLALIIEQLSGKSYPEYMKENIFSPLGMQHSYVFSIKDTNSYKPSYNFNNRIFPLENMDCIYGDKNIYSTVRDLLLWDKALYNNSIISRATYEEATKPYSLEKPSIHNYGLAFRLMIFPDHKIVYHNGWWHGNNAVFSRFVQDTATVIMTGNKFNKMIYTGMKIGTAFGRSMEMQKPEE